VGRINLKGAFKMSLFRINLKSHYVEGGKTYELNAKTQEEAMATVKRFFPEAEILTCELVN
jgi:hypothetical protein